jgi:hypothetical protein
LSDDPWYGTEVDKVLGEVDVGVGNDSLGLVVESIVTGCEDCEACLGVVEAAEEVGLLYEVPVVFEVVRVESSGERAWTSVVSVLRAAVVSNIVESLGEIVPFKVSV